jgi:hypothetical protein
MYDSLHDGKAELKGRKQTRWSGAGDIEYKEAGEFLG